MEQAKSQRKEKGGKMEKFLEELRDQFFEVESKLKAESKFLETLRKGISEKSIKSNSMDRQVEEMVEVRGVILRQVSRGEKTDEDLKIQEGKISEGRNSKERLAAILESDKRELIDTEVKIQRLGKAFEGAGHSLWYAVSQTEGAKIKLDDQNPILRAYAASVLSGIGENFGIFLQQRFNALNFKYDLSKIMDSLQKEYLTPEKRGGEKK